MKKDEYFNKDVERQDDLLKITISCERRPTIFDKKRIFRENVLDLIPDDLKNKVSLLDEPKMTISNLFYEGHSNVGTWTFQINKEKPQQEKRPARSRRVVKKENT